ncbi:hypothetical protein Tco_0439745 [Tanacetum coccineum]
MQKNLAIIAKNFKKIYKPTNNNLRTSSNSRNKNVDTSPRNKNDNQTGQFGNQMTVTVAEARETGKLGSAAEWDTVFQIQGIWSFCQGMQETKKGKKNYSYHKEKMLMCKQAEKGVPLQVEQADWLADTDKDIDEQKLEAHYSYMAKIQEVSNVDSGTDTDPLEQECISNLEESNTTRDRYLIALQHKQTKLEKYMTFNDRTVDYDKLEQMHELESDKAEFSNMYDILFQECVSNDVMCSYLHSLSDLDSHAELQCLYLHKVKKYECLAQNLSKQTETVSKDVYNALLRSFAKLEKYSISLELVVQQCQEQMKNNTVCKEKASNVFLKECEQYFEIQDLKAQLQDKNIAISELKKLIEKCKGNPVETKFDKPYVVRQPNAQRIPKP